MYKTGNNDNIIVDNNYFSSNTANVFGGSLYISGTNSSISVTGSDYINNTAYSLVELSMYLVQTTQSVLPAVPSLTTQQ